jgi:hypothetical protein
MDRLRELMRDLMPWLALAGLTSAAVVGDLAPELKELLIKWGPGLLIFVVVVQQAPAFVRAQEQQAAHLGALTRVVERLPNRDELRFDAVLTGQQVILDRLEEIEAKVATVAAEQCAYRG